MLPEAERQGMGVIVGSPLQQGALARRYDEEIASGAPWLARRAASRYRALYAFADRTALPLPEMGLRFVLSDPRVSITLMGARSVEEVEANVARGRERPIADRHPRRAARNRRSGAIPPLRGAVHPSVWSCL